MWKERILGPLQTKLLESS